MIDIGISGAAGRMGRAIAEAAKADGGFRVAAAIEGPGSPELGRELHGVTVAEHLASRVGALIDFSAPAGTMARLDECVKTKSGLVVGTTGLSDDHRKQLRGAGKAIPVLVSSNMSIGVNVLAKILPEVARLLGAGFDAEMVEAHHRHKKDAPSGTALMLAEALGRKLPIHSIRAGGIVGEHRVVFVSEGESIELTHAAFTRAIFAQGALRAARFVATARPGFYAMTDALGV